MCNMRSFTKSLIKALTVFVFFCYFAECAAGSCLNYGHSCWGAHGKRSGSEDNSQAAKEQNRLMKSRWFLSRLIQTPMELGRLIRENDLEFPNKNGEDARFSVNDIENIRGQGDVDSSQDSSDQLFDEPATGLAIENGRFKMSNLMHKRSVKQN